MTGTGEYQDGVCVGCGREMRRYIPPTLRDNWLEFAIGREFQCDDCSGNDERTAAEEAAKQARIVEARDCRYRVRISGLPERLRAASLSSLAANQPTEDARGWAEGRIRGLMLSGPVGAGKTYTAAAAAIAAMRDRAVTWRFAPSLLQTLSTDRKDPRHEQAIDALLGKGALVLDDIDKVRPTEYGAEQVLAAIDNRISAGAPLMVTMNTELDEIMARYGHYYGEAIASRLAGYCTWHRIAGDDRRIGDAA